MAWGSKIGVSDLIGRLSPSHSPPLESLVVLGSRNITPEDAELLASVYSNARLRVGVVGEVRNEHLPLHSCTVSVSRALLDRDGNLSPAVAEAIQQNTSLRELCMSGHAIGLSGAKAMGTMLRANSTLRLLSVGDRAFGDEAVMLLVSSGLRENVSLQTLDLSSKGLIRCHHMAAVLNRHPLLSDLILSGNNFSSLVATEELCSAVLKCTTLTSLDLSNCELGEGAKSSLSAMVKSTQSLCSLKLNDNPCLGDNGGEEIVSAAMDHCSLSVLNMEFCGLGTRTAGAVAAVLSSPLCSLVELNIGRNPSLGSSGVAAIGKACVDPVCNPKEESGEPRVSAPAVNFSPKVPYTTKVKPFRECSRGYGGLSIQRLERRLSTSLTQSLAKAAIALTLPICYSVSVLLDHLDLSSCGLTGEGASIVLRAGAVELRLFDNALEDKGVPIMMETLFAVDTAPSLARLVALDVGGCCMTCSGLAELLGAISERHDGMRVVEMGGNDVGDEIEEVIIKAQRLRPMLDIAYRIGGSSLRPPPSEPSTATIPRNGKTNQ